MATTKRAKDSTVVPAKKPAKSANKTSKTSSMAERAQAAEARAARAEKALDRLRETTSVRKQFNGFVEFLREQSVVGLAIGLVLGTQAKTLVDQLVTSFINPATGLLLPGQGTLAQKVAHVQFNGKSAVFGWGAFVYSLLTFVIVAALVYFVFKGLHLDRL
ncbi:MAG TPA: MscL family protein, partial [Candidatus Saccharimonadales bacterium]